jgi:hypothetical protein
MTTRRTKLAAALASLTMASATTALLAVAPADADVATTTTASLTFNGAMSVTAQYGKPIAPLVASVSDPEDASVTAGSAVLQQRLPGKSWKIVKTDSDGTDGFGFGSYGSHAKGDVFYRLHYLGGTDPDTSTAYAPSFSPIIRVVTLWNFRDKIACPRACHVSGHLIPRTKHHAIVLQVKHAGAWHHVANTRTTSRGSFRVQLPYVRRDTTFRVVFTRTATINATGLIVHIHVVRRTGAERDLSLR